MPSELASDQASPRPMSVIVADDDDDVRTLVAIAATRAGLDLIDELSDGDSAWEAIQTFVPDIAVLDVAMPGKSGVELTRLIRADERLHGIRVILLTAAVEESARNLGLDAGADQYLGKPFSPRELASRLVDIAAELEAALSSDA